MSPRAEEFKNKLIALMDEYNAEIVEDERDGALWGIIGHDDNTMEDFVITEGGG